MRECGYEIFPKLSLKVELVYSFLKEGLLLFQWVNVLERDDHHIGAIIFSRNEPGPD